MAACMLYEQLQSAERVRTPHGRKNRPEYPQWPYPLPWGLRAADHRQYFRWNSGAGVSLAVDMAEEQERVAALGLDLLGHNHT